MSAGLRVSDITPLGERPADVIRGRTGITVAGVATILGSPIVGAPANGDVIVYDSATDSWTLVSSSTLGTPLTVEETDGTPTVTNVGTIKVPPTGLTDNTGGVVTLNVLTSANGGGGPIKSHGTMGATETFDPADGNVHTGTLNANCTFTLTAPSGSGACSLEFWITEDGTGGWTITWPGSVTEQGTHDTTLSTTQRVIVETVDGASSWVATWVGGTGVSPGTPALTLGTTNATGAASTVIATDATIAVFDATVPVTQALGDSAATGSAAFAARRDHKHGMPALSTATPLVESGAGSAGSGTLSSRDDHVHPAAADVDSASGIAFIVIGQETRVSDGSTVTYSLDNDFEDASVSGRNLTTGHAFTVTENATPSVTISAAGTAGDVLAFGYAASAI